MTTPSDKALVPAPPGPKDALAYEDMRQRELDALIIDQYLDNANTRFTDASMEDLSDDGFEAPRLLDPQVAWAREEARYRAAGPRRRSSLD